MVTSLTRRNFALVNQLTCALMTTADRLRYNSAMSKNEFKDTSFAQLMEELNKLESAIEQRELDDLDQLMSDVARAEAIIDELQSRLKKAEQKIEQSEASATK